MQYITTDTLMKEIMATLAVAAREGRDQDVIRDGLLLYLAAASDHREAVHSMPLVYVQSAIARIMSRLSADDTEQQPKTSAECSFCGSKPPEVRLGAGPNVFICNKCVSTFFEIFENKQT